MVAVAAAGSAPFAAALALLVALAPWAAPREPGALWFLEGASAWDGFAHRVVALPDLDDDGAPDLALSVLGERRVELRSGADGALLGSFRGPESFGFELALVPAAEGRPAALLVSAPLAEGPGLDAGRVSLHALPGGELLWAAEGRVADDRLGQRLAVLRGARGELLHAHAASGCRALDLRDGADLPHPAAESPAGAGAVPLGDVDGDGIADYGLGGAPGSGEGLARIWSGVQGALLHQLHGAGDDSFGWCLASAGDLDGDGADDLLVGAPGDDGTAPDAGAVHVLSGRTGEPLHVLRGDAPDARFGALVGLLGDVDADGRPEAFVTRFVDDGRGGRHTRLELHALPFAAPPAGASDAALAADA